jgi:SAM-dependent methyltransferase
VGSYDATFREFDSPLMRNIRREAFGNDIGQHSWVTAEEIRADIPRLALTAQSRLLDLGCGPAGPLTFIAAVVGCRTTGVDVSGPAISAGRARADALALSARVVLRKADLNEALPFADSSFDAALSVDAVLHLEDRAAMFREVARVLVPGGRFLFTDAGVITGPVSADEIRRRAVHGHIRLVPRGFNEFVLEGAGFRLLQDEDRTAGLESSAGNRLAARRAHRAELEKVEGPAAVEDQERYLETVATLAGRRSLSRFMYLAERVAAAPMIAAVTEVP